MYHITAVADKSHDWKIISVVSPDGDEVHEVSVNRTNKKGEVFPDFDKIIVGADIQGQSWVSQTGKKYLFPPKQARNNLSNDLLQNIANTLVAHRIIIEEIREIVRGNKPKDDYPKREELMGDAPF